jgi:hypothetical protein
VCNDGLDWYIFGTGSWPFFLQGKALGVGKIKRVFLDLDYSRCPVKVAQIWGFKVILTPNPSFPGQHVILRQTP